MKKNLQIGKPIVTVEKDYSEVEEATKNFRAVKVGNLFARRKSMGLVRCRKIADTES
jgi:hypothetical protein